MSCRPETFPPARQTYRWITSLVPASRTCHVRCGTNLCNAGCLGSALHRILSHTLHPRGVTITEQGHVCESSVVSGRPAAQKLQSCELPPRSNNHSLALTDGEVWADAAPCDRTHGAPAHANTCLTLRLPHAVTGTCHRPSRVLTVPCLSLSGYPS